MNVSKEVSFVLKDFMRKNVQFTVYDVTRILRQKDPTINHNHVRAAVENKFFDGNIPGYRRFIGYHLIQFSPPPQIYYNASHNYLEYDPKALDPQAKTVPTNQTQKVSLFAAKVKGRDVWLVSRERHRDGRVTKLAEAGLFQTRNGPSQLIRRERTPSAYEIVEYELLFKRVN